jgi:hypothetical protein
VLALDYQGIRERQVSMEENALLRVELEDKIDDLILFIDVKHGEYEMLEVPKFLPPDIAIIENERRPLTGKRSCHALVLRREPHLQSRAKSPLALQNYQFMKTARQAA